MSRTTSITCIAVWLIGCGLAGCDFRPAVEESYPAADSTGRQESYQDIQAEYLSEMATQDDPTEPPAPSAVDNALKWAEKYAEVTEEMTGLERENDDLREENLGLRDRMIRMEADFGQAQKELADANDMLLQLQGELSKWKNNVLGYRQETREAQKAQMEALVKILTLLGGEVPAEASGDVSMVGGSGN